jgi:hypothetical protein
MNETSSEKTSSEKTSSEKTSSKINDIARVIGSQKVKELASKPIYQRLWNYYSAVGDVLAGKSAMASIFPNTTDIGMRREWAYAEFLRNHLPSICDVFFGGFFFSVTGNESKQMDVIVTSNLSQRYFVPDYGKSFTCIEGAIAAVCLKSNLNKNELEDSLLNIASIPDFMRSTATEFESCTKQNYDNLPVKIIYAPNGIKGQSLFAALIEFYETHPEIPHRLRPDIIHVNQQYVFIKTPDTDFGYAPLIDEGGALGLANAVYLIQDRAITAGKMRFAYIEALVPLIMQHSGKTIFSDSNSDI